MRAGIPVPCGADDALFYGAGILKKIMPRSRNSIVRVLAIAFAAIQLVLTAAAPAMEAYASVGDSAQYVDGNALRSPPRHTHDATTCPVCRLLDSPAQIEYSAATIFISRVHQEQSQIVLSVVQRLIDTGFQSRAPPTIFA